MRYFLFLFIPFCTITVVNTDNSFGAILSDGATLESPLPGSTLSSSSVTASWASNGTAVQEYWLYVGSTKGTKNYLSSGSIPAGTTSWMISNLPTDGSNVWIRLWYKVGDTWDSSDYQYAAQKATGSRNPAINSPAPGSTFSSSKTKLAWSSNGTAVQEYWLYVGSTKGTKNYLSSGSIPAGTTSWTISNLPTDGSSVWLRLWYKVGDTWDSSDYQYAAQKATGSRNPAINSPAPGSTLSSSSVTVSWASNGTAVQEYWLYVGSTKGTKNYLSSGSIPAGTTSRAISNLPTDGSDVWLRLWYKVGKNWSWEDYNYTGGRVTDCRTEIDPSYLETNIRSLIHINTPSDVSNVRQKLVDFIWKNGSFPPNTTLPTNVEVGVVSPISNLRNLNHVERLEIEMDLGFRSIVSHFIPEVDNGRLVLIHHGHSSNLHQNGVERTIRAFLERGFHVVFFNMPLYGSNTGPSDSHNTMAELLSSALNPIKFFLEPIIIALNHLKQSNQFIDVSMIGVSGGGWTTTLYSAIDPEITFSFPVAGTLPLYLRQPPCAQTGVGDWEQHYADLYQLTSYLDLYILGSHEDNRLQLQVLNQFDACCLSGVGYQTYESTLINHLSSLGNGTFSVLLDSTHSKHQISEFALQQIFPLLGDPPIVN